MKPREKPSSRPTTPNNRHKKSVDENKWVWDLYEQIKKVMELSITPLKEYIK
jgi:hypothetical protein